jgi:hypothetical protein
MPVTCNAANTGSMQPSNHRSATEPRQHHARPVRAKSTKRSEQRRQMHVVVPVIPPHQAIRPRRSQTSVSVKRSAGSLREVIPTWQPLDNRAQRFMPHDDHTAYTLLKHRNAAPLAQTRGKPHHPTSRSIRSNEPQTDAVNNPRPTPRPPMHLENHLANEAATSNSSNVRHMYAINHSHGQAELRLKHALPDRARSRSRPKNAGHSNEPQAHPRARRPP